MKVGDHVRLLKYQYIFVKGYITNAMKCDKNKTEVELDLSSYTTKSDLKKSATAVETSNFAKRLISLP